ncbi:MAG: aromatic ring-hydroxylating oxygenase subunit alpha [Burkholderiales bacterium]|jgi:phenylpropionate dioxygenase-like ring-hydroxylating dioxygenase large terminal subunit
MDDGALRALWDRARRAVDRTQVQRAEGRTLPVSRYLDPARLERERALLRRWPQVACASARVAAPGDWTTVELLGVPILVVRGEDGVLRAFLNVCRHRGAVVAQGRGAGRSRFVCRYHSWTYDAAGRLVGRPQEDDFAHAPRGTHGLVEVPVAVRCGIVWVVPTRGTDFDWSGYFGPLADEVESLGYRDDSVCPREGESRHAANWKLLIEGTLETYHFQYLHRNTIAPHFHDDAVIQDHDGPHQRIVIPRRSFPEAAEHIDAPTVEHLGRHASVIYFFFPCSFLLWNGNHASVFVMRPEAVDRTVTDSFLIVTPAHFAAWPDEHWSANWDRLWNPLSEDYEQNVSAQKGMASGANAVLTFGTNEFAAPAFARALEASLDAQDRGPVPPGAG